MEKKVAVVVLNWNGKALLQRYLPSVVEAMPDYGKLYVADNASTDDSVLYIQKEFPQVEIIQNKENFGFATGYNLALKSVTEPYLILLNSDIECPKGWVEPLIEFMDKNPTVGACQPKIIDDANRDKFEYAGASGGFIDFLGFPFCRGRIFNELEVDEGQYNHNTPIFWATGACFVVRKKVFDKLGGFDDDLFAHMEEIDLCWRIQRLGYDIFCIPASRIYHLGGGTLKKLNPKKTYLNFRNNLICILKNMDTEDLKRRLLLKLLMDGIAGIKFLLEGSPLHTISVIRAHLYVYFHFSSILRKRKQLKKELGYHPMPTIYQESIVFKHFLFRVNRFSELNFSAYRTR